MVARVEDGYEPYPLRQHLHDLRIRRFPTLQRVDQLPQGQLRLPAQDEVQSREGAHRLQGQRRDMGAEGDGPAAQRTREEYPMHVVTQRRRGHLRHVVPWTLLLQKLLELGPAHARRVAVDDLDLVFGHQNGSHLRQVHLRPDHILPGAAPHSVLRSDPEPAIGRGRIHQQDIHASGRTGR